MPLCMQLGVEYTKLVSLFKQHIFGWFCKCFSDCFRERLGSALGKGLGKGLCLGLGIKTGLTGPIGTIIPSRFYFQRKRPCFVGVQQLLSSSV